MKFVQVGIGLAFLVSASFFATPRLAAQTSSQPGSLPLSRTGNGPIAVISFADGSSLTTSAERGVSDLVALQPEEAVNLQLNFPASTAGRRVVVQSLDGGFAKASGDGSIVNPDGTLNLTFQAGASPGLNRILILDGGTSSLLRFWVINTEQPTANPPLLR